MILKMEMIYIDKLIIFAGYILATLNRAKQISLKKYYTYKISKVQGKNIIGIGEKTRFRYLKNISIGNGSYINGGDICASKNAKVVIGENCLISYNVHIRTDMHVYQNSNRFINQQGIVEKDIIIKDDVWIGYGAQIMPGVVVNAGAVIAAGAIVTKDVPAYHVVGGIPARTIKIREQL